MLNQIVYWFILEDNGFHIAHITDQRDLSTF